MFSIFRKKKTVDQTEAFKEEQLALLASFQEQMEAYNDRLHQEVARKIASCRKEIGQKNSSVLKIALRVKWLIREIGAMISDHLLELTDEQKAIW